MYAPNGVPWILGLSMGLGCKKSHKCSIAIVAKCVGCRRQYGDSYFKLETFFNFIF